jgi:uncharacterized protein YidB (DUF937 family)
MGMGFVMRATHNPPVLSPPSKEISMGLLDSVLGSVLGGAQGGGGGQAAMLQAVIGMLAQNQGGGLTDLIGKFAQSGLGNVAQSWVGTGENLPISADQISSVLGSDVVGQLAGQLGMSQGDAASGLSQLLPQLVDKLTPNGQLPQAGQGLPDLGSLGGLLGGLLQQR